MLCPGADCNRSAVLSAVLDNRAGHICIKKINFRVLKNTGKPVNTGKQNHHIECERNDRTIYGGFCG